MSGERILIAEDEAVAAIEIESILIKHGYSVIDIVATGKEAIDLGKTTKPDIILMDIRLSDDIDGITAAKEIKKTFDVPIVFITALSDEPTIKKAIEENPAAYIIKPFEEGMIYSSVEIALYKHRLEKELQKEIEERKKTQDQLKHQYQFTNTLLNTIPSPIFYKDREGIYLGCNSAFAEFFEKLESEIIGKTVYDMGPREIADKYNEMDKQLIEKPGIQVYEWKTKTGSEGIRDVIFRKATFEDEKGNISGIIGVILDITEKKQYERSLEEKNTLLNWVSRAMIKLNSIKTSAEFEPFIINEIYKMFKPLLVTYYSYNPEIHCLDFKNVKAKKTLLQKIETIIGEDFRKRSLPLTGNDSKWIFSSTAARIDTVMDLTSGNIPEKTLSSLTENIGLQNIFSFALYQDTKFTGAIIALFDYEVTDFQIEMIKHFINIASSSLLRKKTEELLIEREEKYRLLNHNIPVVVFSKLADSDSTIVFISGRIRELTGYTEQEFLSNPALYLKIIHPSDKDRIIKKFNSKYKNTEPIDLEYRITTKNKIVKWIRNKSTPLLDENKKIIKYDGFLEDITENKTLEKDLIIISEEERRRIGRDLHDGLGQQLTGISILLGAVRKKLQNSQTVDMDEINRISEYLENAITASKDIAKGFSPATRDVQEFIYSLEMLLRNTEKISNKKCTLEKTGHLTIHNSFLLNNLYFIAQEALNNVVKHSNGKNIKIILNSVNSDFSMIIFDDGKVKKRKKINNGIGLKIMEYRANIIGADFTVVSDQEGFQVSVKMKNDPKKT